MSDPTLYIIGKRMTLAKDTHKDKYKDKDKNKYKMLKRPITSREFKDIKYDTNSDHKDKDKYRD